MQVDYVATLVLSGKVNNILINTSNYMVNVKITTPKQLTDVDINVKYPHLSVYTEKSILNHIPKHGKPVD